LVRRKVEGGTSQDARASPARGKGRPRAGARTDEVPSESSLSEIGRRKSSLRSKHKASREGCQARGIKVRIIYHRETLYPQVETAFIDESVASQRAAPDARKSREPLRRIWCMLSFFANATNLWLHSLVCSFSEPVALTL